MSRAHRNRDQHRKRQSMMKVAIEKSGGNGMNFMPRFKPIKVNQLTNEYALGALECLDAQLQCARTDSKRQKLMVRINKYKNKLGLK